MTTSDQTALDSALMLANQKRALARDYDQQAADNRQLADEAEREASSILAPLGRKLGGVLRHVNRNLAAWYDDEVGVALNRHKYDGPPRIEWGNENSHHIGFNCAFNHNSHESAISLCMRLYHHRYRLNMVRQLQTQKYDDIVRTIETLADAGKAAVSVLYRSGAPCWVTQ